MSTLNGYKYYTIDMMSVDMGMYNERGSLMRIHCWLGRSSWIQNRVNDGNIQFVEGRVKQKVGQPASHLCCGHTHRHNQRETILQQDPEQEQKQQ